MAKLAAGIRSFIRTAMDEMAKCTWPEKQEVLESTILVIIALVATSVFVAGVDQILYHAVRFVITF
jgi:preprotein translocase SecE subunit